MMFNNLTLLDLDFIRYGVEVERDLCFKDFVTTYSTNEVIRLQQPWYLEDL